MTREEHLAWAKQRALEYVAAGQLVNAINSMASDLRKHPELEKSADPMFLTLAIMDPTPRGIRRWIEGFN